MLGGMGLLNPCGNTVYADPVTGKIIDCDAVWGNSLFQLPNFLNPTCWAISTQVCAPQGAVIGQTIPPGTPGIDSATGQPTNDDTTPACIQTIFTSIPGLCDWYVYSAVAIITGLVIFKAI